MGPADVLRHGRAGDHPARTQRPPGRAPRPPLQGIPGGLRSRLLSALSDHGGAARGSLRVALLRAGARPGRALAVPARDPCAAVFGLRIRGPGHPLRNRHPAAGRAWAGRPGLPRALPGPRRPRCLPAADRRRGLPEHRVGVRGRGGRGPRSAERAGRSGAALGGSCPWRALCGVVCLVATVRPRDPGPGAARQPDRRPLVGRIGVRGRARGDQWALRRLRICSRRPGRASAVRAVPSRRRLPAAGPARWSRRYGGYGADRRSLERSGSRSLSP